MKSRFWLTNMVSFLLVLPFNIRFTITHTLYYFCVHKKEGKKQTSIVHLQLNVLQEVGLCWDWKKRVWSLLCRCCNLSKLHHMKKKKSTLNDQIHLFFSSQSKLFILQYFFQLYWMYVGIYANPNLKSLNVLIC